MPADALEWHAEYLYRKTFGGLTHEQYLDEPGDAIEWLLRIDKMHRDLDEQRRQQQQRQGGG